MPGLGEGEGRERFMGTEGHLRKMSKFCGQRCWCWSHNNVSVPGTSELCT